MNILLITGEKSGDMHAYALVKLLEQTYSDLDVWGTGGGKLKTTNMHIIQDIDAMSCMGLAAIKKLFFFYKLKQKILQRVNSKPPKLAILVDFAGFNLKLAKSLHAQNIPILYFITPKVWAWGANRIQLLQQYVTHAAVILPFEAELLSNFGIPATYVGNPLMQQLQLTAKPKQQIKTIGLIPGSRINEVTQLLPVFLATAKLLKDSKNYQIILSKSDNLPDSLYQNIPEEIKVYADAKTVMQTSDVVLIASGTATLEAALLQTPMVICYKTDPLTGWLFRKFAQTKLVGLPNIILGKMIAPELLQTAATPKKLAQAVFEVCATPEAQLQEFVKLRELLTTKENYQHNLLGIIKNLLAKTKA